MVSSAQFRFRMVFVNFPPPFGIPLDMRTGLEHLPTELQRNFKLMRDLDARAQTLMQGIDEKGSEFMATLLSDRPSVTEEKRRNMLKSIQEDFNLAKEYGDDKVQLAIQTYELVDKHIRRLDSDLARFEGEIQDKTIMSRSKSEEAVNKSMYRENSYWIISNPVCVCVCVWFSIIPFRKKGGRKKGKDAKVMGKKKRNGGAFGASGGGSPSSDEDVGRGGTGSASVVNVKSSKKSKVNQEKESGGGGSGRKSQKVIHHNLSSLHRILFPDFLLSFWLIF